jgi:hypothetical protein
MKTLLLPLILLLAGLGAGGTVAKLLAPTGKDSASAQNEQCLTPEGDLDMADPPKQDEQTTKAFARLSNQFVVPVVQDGRVKSMVVLSLSAEVDEAKRDAVYEYEPKLRDRFLQDLFNHANAGGFDGTFTDAATLRSLRDILLKTAQSVFGPSITDILIIDISRQDV